MVSGWDTSLTSSALEGLVIRACGRRPEIEPASLVLIGEGISTVTYGLSSDAEQWALRISRQHPDPWTWRGGRRYEVDLLAELRRRDLPVPNSSMVLEEVDGLPSAILEQRVIGVPLTADLIHTNSRLTTTIASVLDRVRSVDVDEAIALGVPRDDPTAEFRQVLGVVDLADEKLHLRVEIAVAELEERREIRVLCHRDFRVEHLIVSEAGDLVGLLDLGEVGADDPAVDLAFLHGELGSEFVAELCQSMTTADAGLGEAARLFHSLWPLLELAPGGEWWGDPATARDRLAELL